MHVHKLKRTRSCHVKRWPTPPSQPRKRDFLRVLQFIEEPFFIKPVSSQKIHSFIHSFISLFAYRETFLILTLQSLQFLRKYYILCDMQCNFLVILENLLGSGKIRRVRFFAICIVLLWFVW